MGQWQLLLAESLLVIFAKIVHQCRKVDQLWACGLQSTATMKYAGDSQS